MAMALTKEYQKLIRRFPLLPLHNDADHEAAMAVITELLDRKDSLTPEEAGYLTVIEQLVDTYENNDPEVRALMARAANISPAESLQYLMEQGNLTLSGLAGEIGCDKGNLSSFLAGKRGLSKSNAVKLAERFKVSVALFLPTQRAVS
jgi:HTH-type transcriptional regulator / antitoxin HigA